MMENPPNYVPHINISCNHHSHVIGFKRLQLVEKVVVFCCKLRLICSYFNPSWEKPVFHKNIVFLQTCKHWRAAKEKILWEGYTTIQVKRSHFNKTNNLSNTALMNASFT